MKRIGLVLCCLLMLFSVAYAEFEGYMIVNPDRNLFVDTNLSGIMGHFEEQSIAYAQNYGGVNMYELKFIDSKTLEYTKAYKNYLCEGSR